MKVWGKEVSCCNMCSYNYYDGLIGGLRCNLENKPTVGDRDKNSVEPIYKDCPFSKPITSSVIESYGFFLIEKYPDELVFEKKDGDYCLYELSLQLEENKFCITQWAQGSLVAKVLPKEEWNTFNLFCGILNNPVELEFILKSLGILE